MLRDSEGDAWADGVEHYNTSLHEGSKVRYWDGHDYEDVFVHDDAGHHHHHHQHHHQEQGQEPHIF